MICGKIKCKKSDLDLLPTLLGGQSFRWKLIESTVKDDNHELDIKKSEDSDNFQKISSKSLNRQSTNNYKQKFIGVMYNNFWELQQSDDYLEYKIYASNSNLNQSKNFYDNLLIEYFNLNINLQELIEKWKLSSQHFEKINKQFSSIRLLKQEPFENIISFLCSQNNNIKRITTMIEWLCKNYGIKICSYHNYDYYTFPTIDSLYNDKDLESKLKLAKFGYRSKYITKTIQQIHEMGNIEWFKQLKLLPYFEAKEELLKLCGIGPKVADCICLMSLNHYGSVPVDTHIFKVAQKYYKKELELENNENLSKNNSIKKNIKNKSKMNKTQNITPVLYDKIGNMFRNVYGPYAGWAQLVLFCSDLKQFQDKV